MRGVRFTKPELAEVRALLESRDSKAARSALAKLELAEMKVIKNTGIGTQQAVAAFREALGGRLVLPPSGATGVWGAMGNRLRMLGLTVDDCRAIAKVARSEWRGPVKAESLVRQADTLLQAATGHVEFNTSNGPAGATELGDEDI